MAFFIRESAPTGLPVSSSRVVRSDDYLVWHDAQTVLDQARADAEAVRESAKDEYERERARGYRDGLESARIEAAEKMIENVGRTIDYFEKVEDRMTQLVMQAMRKIVGGFDDSSRVITVVRGALSAVRNQKQVIVRVPPDREGMLKLAVNDLLAAYPGIGYLDLVPDARLSGDACILETEIGVVEGSLDAQIDALGRAFSRILGSRK